MDVPGKSRSRFISFLIIFLFVIIPIPLSVKFAWEGLEGCCCCCVPRHFPMFNTFFQVFFRTTTVLSFFWALGIVPFALVMDWRCARYYGYKLAPCNWSRVAALVLIGFIIAIASISWDLSLLIYLPYIISIPFLSDIYLQTKPSSFRGPAFLSLAIYMAIIIFTVADSLKSFLVGPLENVGC
jgi:hypothetical protein